MRIAAGTRLGAYEILSVLGIGGMGEVYRARDTRLGREVAIKLILAASGDADRVARFEREAKLLAALNHPHIAALYGLEEHDGQPLLVMELVEGETLADRVARGRLPPGEAVLIASQIADALEAAHARGVVHRDLKPANIKLTPDDQVKVLDFGLAKVVESESTSTDAANSPTLSMMASQAGIILGTAAYMSPEQAKGLSADHRSDIFAFGCVLFEMLTAQRPFQGDTVPEVLASVLVREPDLGRLPSALNPRLVELVRRCLEKNPKRRWQAAGDVRLELEGIAASPLAATTAVPLLTKPRWRRAVPFVTAALVVGALAAATAWLLKPALPQSVVRFSIPVKGGQRFVAGRRLVAISSDGTLIAYVADRRLNIRPIGDFAVSPLPASENGEGVNDPAFSPDGKSLAFYSNGEGVIKRIALGGGAAVTLCEASNPMGLTWTARGIVFALFTADSRQVVRVPVMGGKPEVLVSLSGDEIAEGPEVLPDGDTLLYTLARNTRTGMDRWDKAQIVAQSMTTGARTLLIDGGSDARYLPTGHLAYAVGGTIYAVPFDPGTLKVTGEAVPLVEGVRRASAAVSGMADFGVSANGTLVYTPGPANISAGLSLALFDWQGAMTPVALAPGSYASPRLSPDGSRIAVEAHDARETFIGVYDRSGNAALHRVTFGGNSNSPVWSPDGKRLAFQSAREGDFAVFAQPADGGGAPERLTRPARGERHVPQSWSGDILLFDVVTPNGNTLSQLSLKDGVATPFDGVRSLNETGAAFSPDGRWVAYAIAEGRSSSLFVQPFPPTGAKYMLVTATLNAPHHPVWSADGTMLTYVPAPSQMERVPVTTRPTFAFGNAETAPRSYLAGPPGSRRGFDLTSDGRVLALINPGQPAGPQSQDEIRVVLNWFDEVRSRAPRR